VRQSTPVTDPHTIRGSDRPPVNPPARLPRGELATTLIGELGTGGFSLLKGPPGSGTSWLAMDVARKWPGPVVWTRAGLLWHLGDVARSLWIDAPEVLYRGTGEQLVQVILDTLHRSDTLWVLDDGDDLLTSGAHPRDPDLGILLGALYSGELAEGPGAVLFVSRRTPAGFDAIVHTVPPVPLAAAAKAARRPLDSFDPAWARRPAALPVIAALPPGVPLPADPGGSPWRELIAALGTHRLSHDDREVLLTLASSAHPVPSEALAAACGLEDEVCRRSLLLLLNLGTARHRAGGWWCPRVLATAAREVLPDQVKGVVPRALIQRLAAWYLREGVDGGAEWTSIDPALPSRLALRTWVAADDARGAIQTVRFGHFQNILKRLGAWRALRDDLGYALTGDLSEVDPADLAWARHERSLAAWRIGDHQIAQNELLRAVPEAEAAGDPVLLQTVHTTLARRILLSGEPEQARKHLRIALAIAHAHGDRDAECDLENQRGGIALHGGQLDEAEEAFTRSRAIAVELGDTRRAAARSAALGGVALYRGHLRQAEDLLSAAVAAGRRDGDGRGLVQRLANLALIRSMRQDLRGSLSALGEALAAGGGLDPRSASRLLSLRANLRRLAGDLEGAHGDLEHGRQLVAAAGDREGAGQVEIAFGHWLRTAGRYKEAVAAFEAAGETLPESREDALKAAWEIDRWNAVAWAAAERTVSGTGDGISALLEASANAKDAFKRIPTEPWTPRLTGALQQVTEAELLAATTTGMEPRGLRRRLEEALERELHNPERTNSGEPALRCNLAWAIRLCGDTETAATEARRAAMDAGKIGLATVRGRALAIRRKHPIPEWNRQALLLDRLLS
jgi:tetratricopeptide (TPR) repeat protein